jgi:hypothetical protein
VDYRDSPEEAAFRDRLRRWLAERSGTFATSGDEYWTRQGEWHRALYAAGFFGLSWPREYGGQELPPGYDVIGDEELARAGAPPRPSLGYLVQGLGRHASEELRRRFLPGMIDGTERWCQGFSEPGAGSDLASLTTTATRDGDSYVITGRKIWTSYSDVADWCLLLARTDADAPRHRGLSAFVVSMRQPGIEQRPLRMTNGVSTEFGQVLFDGARVPADQMVGAPGEGWALAMTVVGHEREPAELGYSARYGKLVRDLASRVQEPVPSGRADPGGHSADPGTPRNPGARTPRTCLGGGADRDAPPACAAAVVRTAGRSRAWPRRVSRQAAHDLGRAIRRACGASRGRHLRPRAAERLPVQPGAERHGRDLADPEESGGQ